MRFTAITSSCRWKLQREATERSVRGRDGRDRRVATKIARPGSSYSKLYSRTCEMGGRVERIRVNVQGQRGGRGRKCRAHSLAQSMLAIRIIVWQRVLASFNTLLPHTVAPRAHRRGFLSVPFPSFLLYSAANDVGKWRLFLSRSVGSISHLASVLCKVRWRRDSAPHLCERHIASRIRYD